MRVHDCSGRRPKTAQALQHGQEKRIRVPATKASPCSPCFAAKSTKSAAPRPSSGEDVRIPIVLAQVTSELQQRALRAMAPRYLSAGWKRAYRSREKSTPRSAGPVDQYCMVPLGDLCSIEMRPHIAAAKFAKAGDFLRMIQHERQGGLQGRLIVRLCEPPPSAQHIGNSADGGANARNTHGHRFQQRARCAFRTRVQHEDVASGEKGSYV